MEKPKTMSYGTLSQGRNNKTIQKKKKEHYKPE